MTQTSLISMSILLFIVIGLLSFTIVAFITQKNWATITLLSCTTILTVSIGYGFIALAHYRESRSNNYEIFMQILGYSLPVIFIVALVGFIEKSGSIHKKAVMLEKENNELAAKLNQSHVSQNYTHSTK